MVLVLAIVSSLGQLALPVLAADTEQYQRKYITFFQAEDMPLNAFLIQTFQTGLPRFSYHLLAPSGPTELLTFLQAVKRYQKEHAGELAAKTEADSVQFGDKVVPWSETKRIMDSAYVAAPVWAYSPIVLTGPHHHKEANPPYWAIHAESTLSLTLTMFKLASDVPEQYSQNQQAWSLVREIKIGDTDKLLGMIKEQTGVEINLDDPLQAAAFLEALKQLPGYGDALQKVVSSNPAEYMQGAVQQQVTAASLVSLLTDIKKQPDFVLKGQVTAAEMKENKVTVGFGAKETPASLGVKMDHGYKIIEYRQQGDKEVPVEVGFMKIRQINQQDAQAQPIIVARDFEIGDQYKEYPKTGVQVSIKGGTSSLGLMSVSPFPTINPLTGQPMVESEQMFSPFGELSVEYSLAPLFGVSELYAILNGGAGMVTKPNPMAQIPGQFPGQFPTTGVLPGQEPQATVVLGELGVKKKWYFRQLIVSAELRGGMMMGLLQDPALSQTFQQPGFGQPTFGQPGFGQPVQTETLNQSTFGGTLLVGGHYQLTPDWILGLDLGWRFYMNGGALWSGNLGPRQLTYGLSSNGPVIQLFANYAL